MKTKTYAQGELASTSWTENHRELVLSFNEIDLGQALASYCRTEGTKLGPDLDEGDIYLVLCTGFATLYNRGVLKAVRPFSSNGQRQLDDLLKNFTLAPKGYVVPVAAVIDPFAEVIADFNGGLSMADFKQRCQRDPVYLELYEAAVEAGRIL